MERLKIIFINGLITTGLVALGLLVIAIIAVSFASSLFLASIYPWVGIPVVVLILIFALGYAFEDGFYK